MYGTRYVIAVLLEPSALSNEIDWDTKKVISAKRIELFTVHSKLEHEPARGGSVSSSLGISCSGPGLNFSNKTADRVLEDHYSVVRSISPQEKTGLL